MALTERPELRKQMPTIELDSFRMIDVAYVRSVGNLIEDGYIDLNGQSILDFARTQGQEVFSVQPVRIGEGFGRFKGEEVKVRTRAVEELSGTIYLDGEFFTREQVEALQTDPVNVTPRGKENLLWDIDTNHRKGVVRTRVGIWQPFNEGDSILSTRPQPTP